MTGLSTLVRTEFKLFFRDPAGVFFVLVFPPALLVILGSIPGFGDRDPDLGGLRTIDLYVPIIVAMTIAMLSLSGLPAELATYRERGILRRMATTPVRPAMMLGAQLAVFVLTIVGTTIMLLAIGRMAFGVRLPENLGGYTLAYLLTLITMLSFGLLVAAVIRTGKAAGAVGQVLFFPVVFFGGLWLPRAAMPDTLRQISDYTPLGAGVQSLTDTAAGGTPQLLHVAVMLGWLVVAATAAAKLFRWE